jgi:RimJ/RimL family protein N-acetyltransferase
MPGGAVRARFPAAVNELMVNGLVLEPQRADHAAEMYALLCDPALYEYENEPPPSVAWLRNRYRELESRRSPDGAEQWLNWIVRLPEGRAAGYVQASVRPDGHCHIAYVLGSEFWGQGLARRAVEAMIDELACTYGVHTLWAVFKEENHRSRRLLERLAFGPATAEARGQHELEPGEDIMTRAVVGS